MPLWFLLVLLGIVALAVVPAVSMAVSRRSNSGSDVTIIDER
jgi:hypothetical protein